MRLFSLGLSGGIVEMVFRGDVFSCSDKGWMLLCLATEDEHGYIEECETVG